MRYTHRHKRTEAELLRLVREFDPLAEIHQIQTENPPTWGTVPVKS